MEKRKMILKCLSLAFVLVLCCVMILPAASPVNAFEGNMYAYLTVPYHLNVSWYYDGTTPNTFSHFFSRFWASDEEKIVFYESIGTAATFTGQVDKTGNIPVVYSTFVFEGDVPYVMLNQYDQIVISKEDGLPYLSVSNVDSRMNISVIISGSWITEFAGGTVLQDFSISRDFEVQPETDCVVSSVLTPSDMPTDALIKSISISCESADYSSGFGLDAFRITSEVWDYAAVSANRTLLQDLLAFTYTGSGSGSGTTTPDATTPSTQPPEIIYVGGLGDMGEGIAAVADAFFNVHISEDFTIGHISLVLLGIVIISLVIKFFAGGG